MNMNMNEKTINSPWLKHNYTLTEKKDKGSDYYLSTSMYKS